MNTFTNLVDMVNEEGSDEKFSEMQVVTHRRTKGRWGRIFCARGGNGYLLSLSSGPRTVLGTVINICFPLISSPQKLQNSVITIYIF